MVNLLDRLRRPRSSDAERLTLDDYVALLNEFSFNGVSYVTGGLQQTLSGANERANQDFVGIIQTAYTTNGVVFACMLARQLAFSTPRFQWQRLKNGRPSEFFDTRGLAILEEPWPGGTTQDLLTGLIQDADTAGNAFRVIDTPFARIGGDPSGREIVRLRPDWVEFVLDERIINGGQVGWRKLGYLYTEGGIQSGNDPVPFLSREVAHFAPIPDPLANYRGMSWLTPILREIVADKLMTTHKRMFFENGATPNMIIEYPVEAKLDRIREFKKLLDSEHQGVANAYKRLHLGGGAKAHVVGVDMQSMTFKEVQGAGETRIAAAARVPAVVVGLSEGMQGSSLNAGNYGQARRNFADGCLHPLWQNAAGSLQRLLPKPSRGVRLWYDTRDIPLLREDEKNAAEILQMRASALRQWLDSGFTAESAIAALLADDEGLLEHSGLFSVQLQPAGADNAQSSNNENSLDGQT